MGKVFGAVTGANSAKKAAAAQARALEEQTRQAQASAAESARQAAIQATQAQQREAATRAAEAMQQADAASAAKPEVQTGSGADTSTARKRVRFNHGGQSMASLSI